MGRRSRKRAAAPAAAPPPRDPRSRYARSRERDAEVRAQLDPLGPGERPTAVTVAAIVAAVLAVANVVAAVAGADVGSSAASFTVVSTGLLVAAAGGMWFARYWAVLGFQVILAFQILILAIALGGWLFCKLVKAMARIQMPERRSY